MSTTPAKKNSYVDLIQPLSRPTQKQVADFVQHVAEADNWLKHLPLEDGPPLYIYLDPSAGARLNYRRDTGHYFVEPLSSSSELVHGSELPTDEYRQKFGFLSYHIELGGGTAAVEEGLMQRAMLPEPGIIHRGMFVPFPGPLRAFATRPTTFLHGTFRGVRREGSMRRFRYAIEKLAKQENVPHEHPLIKRLDVWVEKCHAEDQAGFHKWLRASQGENPEDLDANTRWLRYIAWRDEDECVRLHDAQDEAFKKTGIPDEVAKRHNLVLQQMRDSVHALLESLHTMTAH